MGEKFLTSWKILCLTGKGPWTDIHAFFTWRTLYYDKLKKWLCAFYKSYKSHFKKPNKIFHAFKALDASDNF